MDSYSLLLRKIRYDIIWDGLDGATIRLRMYAHTLGLVRLKFEGWDYSGANRVAWSRLSPKYLIRHVLICCASVVTGIPTAKSQDLDVLICDAVTEKRLSVFSSLVIQKMAVIRISER
jgi:hypothetical protein